MFSCDPGNNDADNTDAGLSAKAYTTYLELSWEKVSDVVKYEVQYAADEKMSDAKTVDTYAPEKTISDLTAGTTYYFKVRHFKEGKWSLWSSVIPLKTAELSLVITTYNLLGIAYVDKSPWENRKAAVNNIIRQANNDPDILGCQECANDVQMNGMIDMLKDTYDYHVLNVVDASPRLVFWKKNKFSLVESATIDMLADLYPSASSYTANRYAHYVCLKELTTNKVILVYVVHFKSGSTATHQNIRYQSALTLCSVAKSKSQNYGDAPVIIMGDMNNYSKTTIDGISSAPMGLVSNGFTDTFDMTENRTNGDYDTSNSQENMDNCTINYGANGSIRIDYIFVYPYNKISVSDYSIILNWVNGPGSTVQSPLPSDHNPVRSVVHL